jgi:hypothetical protein
MTGRGGKKRSKSGAPVTPAAPQAKPQKPGAAFPLHEPIGRQLRAMFDEVTSQPVPKKFLELLDELERKHPKR